MENKKILIVEDEIKVANFINKGLQTQNLESDIAYDGLHAKKLFDHHKYDLIILDVNLPDMSGLEVCQYIRKSNDRIPILMLTAMSSISDKLAGFDAGTNDYLVKPFDFMELIVRVKSLLKYLPDTELVEQKLQIADLELDLNEKIARREGKNIDLTYREFRLLEYLMLNKGRVVSKMQITEHAWDINFDTKTNFVEVYINYVRNKVDRGYAVKLIHTVVGLGYMLKQK